jgi:hypothetical protein
MIRFYIMILYIMSEFRPNPLLSEKDMKREASIAHLLEMQSGGMIEGTSSSINNRLKAENHLSIENVVNNIMIADFMKDSLNKIIGIRLAPERLVTHTLAQKAYISSFVLSGLIDIADPVTKANLTDKLPHILASQVGQTHALSVEQLIKEKSQTVYGKVQQATRGFRGHPPSPDIPRWDEKIIAVPDYRTTQYKEVVEDIFLGFKQRSSAETREAVRALPQGAFMSFLSLTEVFGSLQSGDEEFALPNQISFITTPNQGKRQFGSKCGVIVTPIDTYTQQKNDAKLAPDERGVSVAPVPKAVDNPAALLHQEPVDFPESTAILPAQQDTVIGDIPCDPVTKVLDGLSSQKKIASVRPSAESVKTAVLNAYVRLKQHPDHAHKADEYRSKIQVAMRVGDVDELGGLATEILNQLSVSIKP